MKIDRKDEEVTRKDTEQNAKRSRLSAPRACASVPALAASRSGHVETPLAAVHRLVLSSVGAAVPVACCAAERTAGRETRVEDYPCHQPTEQDAGLALPICPAPPNRSSRARHSTTATS